MIRSRHLVIGDRSGVGDARRIAMEAAREAGLGESDAGRVALIVTEAATNLVRHAGGGEMIFAGVSGERGAGLEIVALDRGPGIPDVARALRDGYSTGGSPGTGLGAMARAAASFDVYSQAPGGTAVFACVWAGSAPEEKMVIGGVNVPRPGETVSGDAWVASRIGTRTTVLVADGLGHGPLAAEAANAAVTAFRAGAGDSPAAILERIHGALRPTRGAAVAVTDIDAGRGLVHFAGLGNIAGTIALNGATRSMVSHHGTAGHDVRRIREFTYPWPAGAVLVLHSDGLVSHWTLDRHPGLVMRHPVLVASVLYRDFGRRRDDTTVVVVREAA